MLVCTCLPGRAAELHACHGSWHSGQTAQRQHFTNSRRPLAHRLITVKAQGHEERQLIRQESLSDGSTLFVFGDENEASAHAATVKGKEGADAVPQGSSDPNQPSPKTQDHSERPASDITEQARLSDATGGPETEDSAPPAGGSPETEDTARQQTTDEEPAVSQPPAVEEGTATSDTDSSTASSGLGVPSDEELADMKVAELKDLCRDLNVEGFSKLRKAELIEALSALRQ